MCTGKLPPPPLFCPIAAMVMDDPLISLDRKDWLFLILLSAKCQQKTCFTR